MGEWRVDGRMDGSRLLFWKGRGKFGNQIVTSVDKSLEEWGLDGEGGEGGRELFIYHVWSIDTRRGDVWNMYTCHDSLPSA